MQVFPSVNFVNHDFNRQSLDVLLGEVRAQDDGDGKRSTRISMPDEDAG